MISFTVYGNPKALKRHRTYTKDRKGNALKFARQVDPSAGDKADFLAMALQHKPDVPLEGPLLLACTFYMQRPLGHYSIRKNGKHLKETASKWQTGKPDADNLAKFVMDSLNGIFWKDDSQICELASSKLYDETPRTEILIGVLG
jgi:Holliday junction resolvase RusA-like endonuclease